MPASGDPGLCAGRGGPVPWWGVPVPADAPLVGDPPLRRAGHSLLCLHGVLAARAVRRPRRDPPGRRGEARSGHAGRRTPRRAAPRRQRDLRAARHRDRALRRAVRRARTGARRQARLLCADPAAYGRRQGPARRARMAARRGEGRGRALGRGHRDRRAPGVRELGHRRRAHRRRTASGAAGDDQRRVARQPRSVRRVRRLDHPHRGRSRPAARPRGRATGQRPRSQGVPEPRLHRRVVRLRGLRALHVVPAHAP